MPDDIRIIFHTCPKLKHVVNVGDKNVPQFTISPVSKDNEGDGLRLVVTRYAYHMGLLVVLIGAIPQLKEIQLPAATHIDRSRIEYTCTQNGIKLVWV
jgi:hypothetical protein